MLTKLKDPSRGHGVCLKVGGRGGGWLGLSIDHRSERGGGVRFRRQQHRRKKVRGGGEEAIAPQPFLSAAPAKQ